MRSWPAALLLISACAPITVLRAPSSWPAQEGTLEVRGLEAPVVIQRDPTGVPHVRARSMDDLWFALGLSHAQDRLFQADLTRRFVYGGLSEWFGEPAVEVDTFARLLQLRRVAQESYDSLPPHTQQSLTAYTNGLNAGARSLPRLPVEYQLLNASFARWTPTDCLAVHLANAWFLAKNPGTELFALAARRRLSTQQLSDLIRPLGGPPIDLYWPSLVNAELGPFTQSFKAFAGEIGEHPEIAASNAWAVSGAKTASGAPLLASDPHLVQSVPSLWYFADLQSDTLHVAGATLAGSPGVAIGHNETLAWGLTNVMADTIDFAVLERHGPSGYIYQGHVKELIPQRLHIQTPSGVVKRTGWTSEVGPIVTELNAPYVLAMRWAGVAAADHTSELLLSLNAAHSVSEAVAATEVPSVLPMNLILADSNGAIGWTVFGAMPRRQGYSGRVPYPASIQGYDWQGWLDRLPRSINPAEGYVASANNRPEGPIADAISTSYMADWRVNRIRDGLKGNTLRPEDMRALQGDVYSDRAKTHIERLLGGVTWLSDDAAQCGALLTQWDFSQDADQVGPTVWFTFERELLRVALAHTLGEPLFQDYLRQFHPGQTLLDGPLLTFLPDKDAAVNLALERSCVRLRAELGSKPERWTWGEVHRLHLQHPFAAQSAFIDRRWSSQSVPYGGGANTLNAASFSLEGQPTVQFMTSMRLVVPLEDVKSSTYSHPGGASGHPGHPQSFNQWSAFVEQKTSVLGFGPPSEGPTLLLKPASAP